MGNAIVPGKYTVGLTGGIGSGKTMVANLFAARGASAIDTDQIAHELTAPGGIAIPEIKARFGDAFITSAGALDRARMRQHVFTDPAAKTELESILHPLIYIETVRKAVQATGSYLIFAVPLLVESGTWQNRVSRVLVVDCSEELQVQRVMRRNELGETQVRAIMATQASRETRLAIADDVILNNGDGAALIPQIDRYHAFYLSMANAGPSE
jgi:dephospho-CoA kinase